jgi:hypothetical protein
MAILALTTTSEDRLFSLPLAIRELVWEQAAVEFNWTTYGRYEKLDNYWVAPTEAAGFSPYRMYPKLPAIAMTCKQAYVEITPIFYRRNIISFPYLPSQTKPFRIKTFGDWLNCPVRTTLHHKALVANLKHIKLAYRLHSAMYKDALIAHLEKDRAVAVECHQVWRVRVG